MVSESAERTGSGIAANCSPGLGSRAGGRRAGADRFGVVVSLLFLAGAGWSLEDSGDSVVDGFLIDDSGAGDGD